MDAAATANSKTQLIVVVLFVIVYSNTYRVKKAEVHFEDTEATQVTLFM